MRSHFLLVGGWWLVVGGWWWVILFHRNPDTNTDGVETRLVRLYNIYSRCLLDEVQLYHYLGHSIAVPYPTAYRSALGERGTQRKV
ncbi:MAG: hypothetical protein ACHBN1_03220 [Heteroscytonema crispum UTEX LB 1556]